MDFATMYSSIWEMVTIELMMKFFLAYFFLVWISLIIWVTRDITLRSSSLITQFLCVCIIIFLTPIGILLYLLVRPRKDVFEKYIEEVEGNLDILDDIVKEHIQTKQNSTLACPHCNVAIQAEFIICPSCKQSLKDTCKGCNRIIRDTWSVCPYCETPQEKQSSQGSEKKEKKKEKVSKKKK